jgi:hypothetical protein
VPYRTNGRQAPCLKPAASLYWRTVRRAIKWAVVGRRKEGSYHWDKSSYNQRWQFLLSCETLSDSDDGED